MHFTYCKMHTILSRDIKIMSACVYVPPSQVLNELNGFHKSWYKRCCQELPKWPQSVITARQTAVALAPCHMLS